MADPVQALIALAQERPDPKVIANWIAAYLGKRSASARRTALQALETAFSERQKDPAQARVATLVVRVVQKLLSQNR